MFKFTTLAALVAASTVAAQTRRLSEAAADVLPTGTEAVASAEEDEMPATGTEAGIQNAVDPDGSVREDNFELGDAGEDDDARPAPASIGSDVPISYFGPAPSQVDRRLIGPFQLLKSGVVDQDAGTITLPVYLGTVDATEDQPAESFFYVVTDTTDEANAAALGLNHSPKLRYSQVGRGAREAYLGTDLIVHFVNGRVDFTPERTVVPGEDTPFPPASATAGSVGDEFYSPLFFLTNGGGEVYNAPIVAADVGVETLQKYCDGIPEDDELARTFIHDSVVAICPDDGGIGGTVTINLSPGFSFARPVLYLSLDASIEVAAALESATLAPGLLDIPLGGDDSLFSSAERIFITINGPSNSDIPEGSNFTVNPNRQGLNSAVDGEGGPLNVLGGIPTIATDYSPLWDANLGEWTEEAIDAGFRVRLLEEFQILGYAANGFLTGPDGAPYGSSGFIVNCPIVFRFL